jgi:Domain of unknown function (DUF1905)
MCGAAEPLAVFRFEAEIIHWRGPSPFFFIRTPTPVASELGRLMRTVSYGWGMIPVQAEVAGVAFTTALFPKDGGYLLPVKAVVRRSAGVTAGDRVSVTLTVQAPQR